MVGFHEICRIRSTGYKSSAWINLPALASCLLAAVGLAAGGCAPPSAVILSREEQRWCTNGSSNALSVAAAMDRLDIPEPSPGFLKARLESNGFAALGDTVPSWALTAAADHALMSDMARDRPGDYAMACRDAYAKRDYIRDLPTGPRPAP